MKRHQTRSLLLPITAAEELRKIRQVVAEPAEKGTAPSTSEAQADPEKPAPPPMMLGPAQRLVNMLGACVRPELQRREHVEDCTAAVQAVNAASARAAASKLLDLIADPELRQAAALAFCSLEYVAAALLQQAEAEEADAMAKVA